MKLLLVVIMKNDDYRNRVLNELGKYETTGTVIPTTSMRNAITQSCVEPLPNFGGLRQIYENDRSLNTTILAVIEEEELEQVKALIKNVSVKNQENEGIMFAVPVMYFEELKD